MYTPAVAVFLATLSTSKLDVTEFYINDIDDDFCLSDPPTLGLTAALTSQSVLRYGTYVISKGTGKGNLTKPNISAGDSGGEPDAHDVDRNSNPIEALVFSTAFLTGVCMDDSEPRIVRIYTM
ncbi:uncharacterized protein ARMOST_21595 [Armillaria ostoyae]|uniref:Uncharacterized protein n=1 Tax=Armillaria ostoyae TaxID=47428 RepID=A0A284SAJ1_ARMOS|nr:uncharacterized protein ARMOST_21595 [Armillaria ostoyae]